jgi:hypothetical protein
VFLVVGLGVVIGRLKVGGVCLGTVTGAVFAGLLVGQIEIPVAGSLLCGALTQSPAIVRPYPQCCEFADDLAEPGCVCRHEWNASGDSLRRRLQSSGRLPDAGGVAVTLSPLVSWVYFGRYVVKLNPIFILRACAGAQTVTAAMGGVQENRAAGHPLSVTRCRTQSDISCLPFGDPSFSHFLS